MFGAKGGTHNLGLKRARQHTGFVLGTLAGMRTPLAARSALVALFLVVLGLGLTGCDARQEDKDEINQLLFDLNYYNNAANGAAIVEVFDEDSFRHNEELLKAGLDGSEKEVRALPISDRLEVLRMRARATRAELEKLDGRGYAQFSTSRGWYITPPKERSEDALERFRFSEDGKEAWAYLVVDGEKVDVRFHFVKEGGRWRIDERRAMRSMDRFYAAEAREFGMSEDEYLLDLLEEETGKPVPKTVWQPMRGGAGGAGGVGGAGGIEDTDGGGGE